MGFFRVLGAIVLVVLAIGLAGAIFQTGYLAGVAADGGVAPVVVGPGYGYGWHGWGWGFGGGILGILGFLFFLLVFIAILRAVFGGGRGGWGRGGWGRGGWGPGGWGPGGYGHHTGRLGPWEERAREAHDEWHRRGDSASTSGAGGTTPSGGSNPNDPPSGGAA